MSETTTCRMPDCDAPAKYRGLCGRHYAWLAQGTEERKADAAAHALPPKPRGERLRRRTAAPAAGRAGDVIAVVTEFAAAFHIAHTPIHDGVLFVDERRPGSAIFLTSIGTLQEWAMTPKTAS